MYLRTVHENGTSFTIYNNLLHLTSRGHCACDYRVYMVVKLTSNNTLPLNEVVNLIHTDIHGQMYLIQHITFVCDLRQVCDSRPIVIQPIKSQFSKRKRFPCKLK